MDIIYIILAILGVYMASLATFALICGLRLVNVVFFDTTKTTTGENKTTRARDLYKHPNTAVEKITENLMQNFLKEAINKSKTWTATGEDDQGGGIGGKIGEFIEQFGIGDLVDFAKANPDKVKEFVSALTPEEKGQPAVKAML